MNSIFKTDLFLNKTVTASNTRYNLSDYAAGNVNDANRRTFWVTDPGQQNAELVIDLEKPTELNIVRLEEEIRYGQRVSSFVLSALVDGAWETLYIGTTIGNTRLLRFGMKTVTKVKLEILESYGSPTIRVFSGYKYNF